MNKKKNDIMNTTIQLDENTMKLTLDDATLVTFRGSILIARPVRGIHIAYSSTEVFLSAFVRKRAPSQSQWWRFVIVQFRSTHDHVSKIRQPS